MATKPDTMGAVSAEVIAVEDRSRIEIDSATRSLACHDIFVGAGLILGR